jgi:type I restriction enzyme S subunit
MSIATASLGDVADVVMGQAPSGESYNHEGEGWPLIAGAGDFGESVPVAKKFTTAPSKLCSDGDIVLGIRASIGEKVLADGQYCLGRGVAGLRAKRNLDQRYLWHWLTHSEAELSSKGRGATFKQVNRQDICELMIPLPSLAEQRRIAAILDQADALRAKRREALAHLDDLTQSIFLDMFGDPASKSNGGKWARLGDLASKFSDGPFGSNLKSSHYTEAGVRVVRLQNIGVGEFVDNDQAYVSDSHFASLGKHRCQPGDVLVATLGDPNLRACIQPDWLPVALNKADCVQIRVDPSIATPEFVSALINQPGTLTLAYSLMLGQTRVRISMGRLRELKVPVPPLEQQHEFAKIIRSVERVKKQQCEHLAHLVAVFKSLQSRAFAGEL